MTTRRDKLERLRVESPCPNPWDGMCGDGRKRHCLQCDKPVYDFAQLTPREIAGVIEAGRGELCARLMRDDWGRLVTLEPAVAAEPLAPRRASPLLTAAVAAVLGLRGAAWTDPAVAVSPAVEQGAGERPGDDRPQRTGDAGGFVSGRVATDSGEPVPEAEVRLYNRLDGQQRAARTDAEGRFSFASVRAGIYGIKASVGGRDAAYQDDVLLAAGEQRQIGLTVPTDVWQSIVTGEPVWSISGGVIIVPVEPMHRLYEESGLVVLAEAGKSVAVRQGEYTREVRTELVVSAVLKGDTRERVISIHHDQGPDEAPESRFPPGVHVLAFLEPREAENGRGSDGYVAADAVSGLRELSGAELEAYRQRVEALAEVPRNGAARPAELLEWLVATSEEPATRKEAVHELSWAVRQLAWKAGERKVPVERYAQELRDVLSDFVSAGGTPDREVSPAVLGAFLTDAHRERLTAALLRTSQVTATDLELYGIVGPWHEDRLLPWLVDRLESAELSRGTGRLLMARIAGALDDPDLAEILATGEAEILPLEHQLYGGSEDAARLGRQLEEAEEELRSRFVEALGRRGSR